MGWTIHIFKKLKGKFVSKSYEGTFLGYSTRSKSYKSLNKPTKKMIESAKVKIDEFSKNGEDSKKEPGD